MSRFTRRLASAWLILYCSSSSAILDFIAEETKGVAEAAGVVDATLDLFDEVTPDTEARNQLQEISRNTSRLRASAQNVRFLSQDTRSVLEGPKYTSNHLDSNIRATTNYVRRLKMVIVRLAALGTDAITAFTGIHTNKQLNEIQKNQQILILQNEARSNREIAKELEEAQKWELFITTQKAYRTGSVVRK